MDVATGLRLLHPLDAELTLAASGPVPPALAWERYDRLCLWPTWSPHLGEVAADVPGEDPRLAPGLTGTVHAPLRAVSARFRVLGVDEAGMTWSWAVRKGPLQVRLTHGVEPGGPDGTGSRTWLVLRGPSPAIIGYAAPARYALHRLVTLPAEA